MKKIIAILMAFLVIAPITVDAGNPTKQTAKQLQKARSKMAKEKLKQLKKEKWTIFGSTNTLETALLDHYNKLNTIEGAYEVSGVATNFKSKNIGKQATYNNACVIYAQQCGSDLAGRMVSDIFADSSHPEAEFDKFYAAYERGVQKEIRGEMKESFTIYRELPDGTMEMQTYFIVDEKGAESARLRALEAALKESQLAQKYANEIHDFVVGK